MAVIKKFSLFLALTLSITLVTGYSVQKPNVNNNACTVPETYKRAEVITSYDEAKKLLVEGNNRFSANKAAMKNISSERREELSKKGQHPFAIIVSCSDSRVPPELVFDQALGDLFVVRDAGNVIDAVTLGSVEYGAEHLNAPLIVVMGHEKCGAVIAAVDGGEASGSIGAITKKIIPSFEKAKAESPNATKAELYEKTADENIKNSIAEIKKSSVIKKLENEKKLKVIGAKYDLDTGIVTFME
ncbi:MAG: carbonic anhydrase [Bacillota bacterium]|nr:carbonic anhydrase [Bacillota bacterium]